MATLAHDRAGGFGRASDFDAASRAMLERAIAAAESNIPEPNGWLGRLVGRDRSAAALVHRYRLLPAIEHAYARVTREFGPIGVEVSAEGGDGPDFVMVTFFCESLDFERMYDLGSDVVTECSSMIGARDWYRLVVGVEPR